MAGCQPCHLRLDAPVQRLREHFDVLESTEVSAVPTEMLMRGPSRRVTSCSNCSAQFVFPRVLLRLWCPLRLQPGVHCMHHTLLLRCRHALRLQCAATERGGLRVGTTFFEL